MVGEPPDFPQDVPEAMAYVFDVLSGLNKVAQSYEQRELSYLIEMAAMHAKTIEDAERKAREKKDADDHHGDEG